MAKYTRGSMSPEEEERIEKGHDKILAALREGPKTNKFLSTIALDYGRHIRALRKKLHNIRCEYMVKGLYSYTLIHGLDPQWRVTVNVILADGRVIPQTFIVRAHNLNTARNRAQHLATKIKILSTVKLEPLPPELPPPSPQPPQPPKSSGIPFSSFR